MPFETVCCTESYLSPKNPILGILRILGNDSEFTVEHSYAIFHILIILTGNCIISVTEVWSFTTGNLQTGICHIVFPGFTFWKLNFLLIVNPLLRVFRVGRIEETFFSAEPFFINEIVLCITNPCRSKYLCLILCTLRLFFFRLYGTWSDNLLVIVFLLRILFDQLIVLLLCNHLAFF